MPLRRLHMARLSKTSFTKVGPGVQAILRFGLRYLRGGNAVITYGRDLQIMPL
jgi:hypothetical protein